LENSGTGDTVRVAFFKKMHMNTLDGYIRCEEKAIRVKVMTLMVTWTASLVPSLGVGMRIKEGHPHEAEFHCSFSVFLPSAANNKQGTHSKCLHRSPLPLFSSSSLSLLFSLLLHSSSLSAQPTLCSTHPLLNPPSAHPFLHSSCLVIRVSFFLHSFLSTKRKEK
jgi:hypothetical protein